MRGRFSLGAGRGVSGQTTWQSSRDQPRDGGALGCFAIGGSSAGRSVHNVFGWDFGRQAQRRHRCLIRSDRDPLWHHARGAPAASAPRVAHPMVRRSMNSATRYMPMPMRLVIRRPAKASGTSKREEATSIRLPMPLLAATVSATIEPTNANVIATFSEAKKYGIDRGSPTF